jgi:hypothetical protein
MQPLVRRRRLLIAEGHGKIGPEEVRLDTLGLDLSPAD